MWNILPDKLKKIDSLRSVKTAIKSLRPEKCPYRLCRIYIYNFGFFYENLDLLKQAKDKNDVNIQVNISICITMAYMFYFTFNFVNFYYRKLAPISASN